MVRRPKQPKRRRQQGELPGEYQKKSLVTVPRGMLEDGGRIREDHWVVDTRRLDRRWTVRIEKTGENLEITLPHKVIQQIERHMKAVLVLETEDRRFERSERGKKLMAERMAGGETPGFLREVPRAEEVV